MRLYEHEGKDLLHSAGLLTPQPLQLAPLDQLQWQGPCVLKAQVLFGNRAQQSLIQVVTQPAEWNTKCSALQTALTPLVPDITATVILMEPLITFQEEWYLALHYDTDTRRPVLWFSSQGGTGIEHRATQSDMQTLPLEQLDQTPLPSLHPSLPLEWLQTFTNLFFAQDLRLLEINPLVLTDQGPLILDAKVELDDTATYRHPEWEANYPPRSLFARPPTQAEQAAKKINALDHRGVAGASYFDFEGSIAVLGSGGGASILAMDTLLTTTLRPANYTEYSGNPTREKVAALTQLVLAKPDLEGLWVVGGHANFTDQYETLMGVMDGLSQAKLPAHFPVVIRRGGPRLEEAFTALRERAADLSLDLQLFSSDTPIPETAFVLEKAVLARREQS